MKKTVDLILFAGQSNMAGRGICCTRWPQTAPRTGSEEGYEFRAVTDPTRLYPLTEPFGKLENRQGGIDDGAKKTGSMVSAFAKAYYKENGHVPVVGVSASKGGSSIKEWQPGTPYLTDAIQRYRCAADWLKTNGYQIRHSFLLWCQGETDGDRGTEEQEYKSMFRRFWSRMREEGIEHLFLVIIGNCNVPGAYDRYASVIRWQRELTETEENVVSAADVFSSMREEGLMKDEFHYYQEGYNRCGTAAGTVAAQWVSGREA